jgi:tetratricopeptide (TPR) repeat protein
MSISLDNVGGVEMARGNLDAASAAYGESLRIARGLSDPQQPQTLRDVSVSLNNVGGVEMARGNLDAASAAYGESLRIRRGLWDPQQPQTLRDVSVSLNNVGGVEMARGKHGEARKNFEESLRVLTNLQRDGKLFPQWRNDIAWVKQQLVRLDSETRGGAQVDIPRGHPGADADRAVALNIAYLKDLAAWNALPFLKRLRTKKPQPPEGI